MPKAGRFSRTPLDLKASNTLFIVDVPTKNRESRGVQRRDIVRSLSRNSVAMMTLNKEKSLTTERKHNFNWMEQDTTIQLSHLPQHPIHISLFKNVQNSAYLREQLLAMNAEFEYGFLDFICEPSARSGVSSNQWHESWSSEEPQRTFWGRVFFESKQQCGLLLN